MADTLDKYKEKRDFTKTEEPSGEKAEQSQRLRFVVQHHLARRNHYDFRLEWDGVLLSWAVPKGPSYNPQDKRLAIQVEPHPFEYRNFEGIIPKGEYGGGTVMIWDEGVWHPHGDVSQGMENGVLKFELFGERLKGGWALIRLKEDDSSSKENWLLLKEKDEYVREDDGISHFQTSVRTHRNMTEIEQQSVPEEKKTLSSMQRRN